MDTYPVNPFSCSFCGKTEDQVDYLVKGPAVYICNECVDLCVEIIKDARVIPSKEPK